MNSERTLSILYEMALVIGSHDHTEPLLLDTLQRFLHHTTFPCGMILFNKPQQEINCIDPAENHPHRLQLAIGDSELIKHTGSLLSFPCGLLEPKTHLLDIQALLTPLPVKQNYYKAILSLPIHGHGVILLLSPKVPKADTHFEQIFKPILSNLANAINFCRFHETHTDELISSRDQAMEQLAQSESRFRTVVETVPNIIYRADIATGYPTYVSPAIEELLGFTPEEWLDNPLLWSQQIYHEDRRIFNRVFGNEIYKTGTYKVEYRIWNKDGTTLRWFTDRYALETNDEGAPASIIGTISDVTEQKLAEEKLFKEKERAQVTLDSIGDAVITTDNNNEIEYMNPVAKALTGWNDDAYGRPLLEVYQTFNSLAHQRTTDPFQTRTHKDRYSDLHGHLILINKQGTEIPVVDTTSLIHDNECNTTGVVIVFHDVSKERELTEKLSWQATHDSLTGLTNRYEFELRLGECIEKAKKDSSHHALLYLDLDKFKVINDTCGHSAGDELLRHLSESLKKQMRDFDTLARIGGDEFGLLLENCPLEIASNIATKIQQEISNFHFIWKEHSFDIGVSIGLTEITSISAHVTDVMSAADMACYAAKEQGRNRIHIFQHDDIELARLRSEVKLASQINEALKNNTFKLIFQPIRPVIDSPDLIAHHEVLLRMLSQDGELITGTEFIPVAERYNLMPAIDRWVIHELFLSKKEYIRTEHEKIACHDTSNTHTCLLSVNLSGTSLGDEGLLDFIKNEIEEHAIPHAAICFEITETAAISNLNVASHFIKELRKLGCRFSLDDFGSGLSSFGYLKDLPVDFLKIDGSFVHDMVTNSMNLAMVESINHIGHVLGMQTIAEFVESEEILLKLRELGVDYAQGFAITAPELL